MKHLQYKELDDRIHSFLLKKAVRKNLSQTIVDWLSDAYAGDRRTKTLHHNQQPWSDYVLM